MNKIDRYLGVSFVGGCIPVLLLLLTLFGFLALSEELEDVGEGTYQLTDALLVVAYTIPSLLVALLPVTVLLGGLLGLGGLANSLELTAMRAAAISPLRMAMPIIRITLVLIAFIMLLQHLVIPRVEYSAAQHRAKTLIEPFSVGLEDEVGIHQGQAQDEEVWTRSRGQIIRFGAVQRDRSLTSVEVYQFGMEGDLTAILQTPRAELLQDNTWLLHDVHETQLDQEHAETQFRQQLLRNALLSEEQARTLIIPASSLAPHDLWESIKRLEENNMNSESHRVLFWTQMSIPLGLLGMALLSIPFLVGSTRSVSVGQRITVGALIGITYYLAQQISGHLAGIMQWNVALTVLAPGLLVFCLAAILLARAN